jgi:nucleoside diphosphate kinase
MAREKAFAVIKPDACSRNIAGGVLAKIEENGHQGAADDQEAG